MERFNDFLRAHPLDERAPASSTFSVRFMKPRHSNLRKRKAIRIRFPEATKAIEEWAKLVSKYPESAEARAAMLKSGYILEEKLGDFERALKLYQKLARRTRRRRAQVAITRLTQKALQLSAGPCSAPTRGRPSTSSCATSRNARCASTRSILRQYFRKMHGITGVEGLDVPDPAGQDSGSSSPRATRNTSRLNRCGDPVQRQRSRCLCRHHRR